MYTYFDLWSRVGQRCAMAEPPACPSTPGYWVLGGLLGVGPSSTSLIEEKFPYPSRDPQPYTLNPNLNLLLN